VAAGGVGLGASAGPDRTGAPAPKGENRDRDQRGQHREREQRTDDRERGNHCGGERVPAVLQAGQEAGLGPVRRDGVSR